MDSCFIMDLPDDCLYFIFQRLECGSDRESFGLTCRRWLHIQNTSRRSLQFRCSFSVLNISTLQRTSTTVSPFHLHRLLSRFCQLHMLSLSGCMELPDSGLTQLQYYGKKLQSLHLDCCFCITDYGLSFIALGCASLTAISLYRCKITDVGLETLAKSCLCLKDVNLSYCTMISDSGVRVVCENCCHLRAVRVSHCTSVTGTGFKGCSDTLAYLEADFCKLEPDGILGIVSGGGLEYLNVSSLSWSVSGAGLAAIGFGFALRLKVLDFRLCRAISDESIISIAKGCPSLVEWNLALCHEVRVSGWESIGSNCCNLERLHVNRCRNFCDRGLQALSDGCKRLSILYMNQCCRVTSTAIELFKSSRGDVKIKNEEVMCIAPKWAF